MTQHVRMDGEGETGCFLKPAALIDVRHPVVNRQREGGLLALQAAWGTQLTAVDGSGQLVT